MRHIVNLSGGKDSTLAVHLLLDQGVDITDLVYFDTGWDFPQMEKHLQLVEQKTGLHIIRLRYYRRFEDLLTVYGWPMPKKTQWCTACKRDTIIRYVRGIKGEKRQYIGFSADETIRASRSGMSTKKQTCQVCFPLIEAGITEAEALRQCYRLGYTWDGLYEHMDRVSCWCCPCAGKTRRKLIADHFPELDREWSRLDALNEIAVNKRQLALAGGEGEA